MKKKNFRFRKFNPSTSSGRGKKGAFGVLFSFLITLIAIPFWAGAFISYDPYVNIFSADAKNGFYVNQNIEFKIQGGDKQDSSINAVLDYGDGNASYNFSLYTGSSYLQTHSYKDNGSYFPKLTLKDSTGRTKIFKLTLKIEKEWRPSIKNFSFDEQSSKVLGEKIYIDYEIDCKNEDNYKAEIRWSDNNTERADILCGPAVISYEYSQIGTYDITLSLKDVNNNLVESKTLTAVVRDETVYYEGSHNPKARFFIKTTWPREDEAISFNDSSTDPDGRGDIKYWSWNFGDGSTSVDINPTHTYNNPGQYKVSLKVTDNARLYDEYYQWIDVYKASDHNLVRVSGQDKVYQIINGKYHWIPTANIFANYGFSTGEIRTISQAELNTYSRVKVVRVSGSSDIYYITESWMKRKMPNMDTFYSYGNKLEDVVSISQEELNWYLENHLIKYDNDWKIYYLENGLKRWITSASAFNRHGYDWSRIAPVNSTEINAWPTGSAIN